MKLKIYKTGSVVFKINAHRKFFYIPTQKSCLNHLMKHASYY